MSDSTCRTGVGEEVLSSLGGLRGSEDLDAFLERHSEIVTPATVEQLDELVRQRVRVDLDEALRLSDAALAIAHKLSDRPSLGRSLRAKANVLWFKGDCRAAVELFDRSAADFEAEGLVAELGRTLSSSIQALSLLGEYDRAYTSAAKARQIFSALGDDWRRARLELNIANILHRQDRFAEALTTYERVYAELLPYKDAEGLSVALHNIAVCLIMLNGFDRALDCYERARELCRQSGMPLLELQADYNIAYLHFLRGDYDKAIEGLTRTRQRALENGDAYHLALCDLDQAEILVELNLTDDAARLASEARERFEALGMAFETGRSIANLAIATHRQMNSVHALELFAQAKAIFERENNQGWQALINVYRAMLLFELGKYDEARELCWTARAFFESQCLDRREIACDLLLARLSLNTGRADEARTCCQTVLQKLHAIEAPLLAFQAHLLLGHAERMLGDWKAAYVCYNHARSELEALRSSVQCEELKISFLKDKSDVYQSLVEVCWNEGSETAAETVFRHIEQAKSRTLAEMVFGRSGRIGWSEMSGSIAGRIRTLKAELNWLYHRIDLEQTSQDGISVERINSLRTEARHKEDEFLRTIRARDSLKSQSNVIESAVPIEPREITTALHREAVIVEYFETGTDFVAAVVNNFSTEIVRLAPVRQVSSNIQMLQFQLSKFRLSTSYSDAFQAELLATIRNRLQNLYGDLIEPLSSLLQARHIVVVPHGILHYLPFHALFDGTQYLIDRFTISFAPSASIYTMCHQRQANSEGISLLMGVQDENAPFIGREIHAVAAAVSEPRVFLGADATTEVLRSAGPDSRLIHIATHGFFRTDNPMFSSVRLADSYLNLYDLYDLRLPVELLTLSGCGTGLSVVAAGDELLGLTRGLLCAGVQSVLLSLWDVHDRTTAEFMSCFYSHLRQEREKGAALKAAMLETRARQPHPYFWAPFVLVGKALND